jgi:hypothetical protein
MRELVKRRGAAGVAWFAVVIALAGGSAYAGARLGRNAVKAANIAPGAVTNKHTRSLEVSKVVGVKAFAGGLAGAPKRLLVARGPFKLYGQCYAGPDLDNPVTNGLVSLRTSAPAVGAINGNTRAGGGPGYWDNSQLGGALAAAAASQNDADYDQGSVQLIAGKTAFDATFEVAAKTGTPPAGNGPYGSGQRCLFHAMQTGAG